MDAYLMGLLLGDGTSNYSKSNGAYQVWIDQKRFDNEYIAQEAKRLFEKLGFNVCYYYFLDKVRARVYSKELFTLFRNMKSNPKAYFDNLSSKNKLKFISGFFDAEGTVTDRYVIYNGDSILLESMQSFLETKSIVSYIYKFGKVFGLQIYRKNDMIKFKKIIRSLKVYRIPSVKKLR